MINARQVLYKAVNVVAKTFLQAGWNSNLEDSTRDLANLIASAKKSVHLVAGELDHNVFEDDRVVDAMANAISDEEGSVKIDVLCGPNTDHDTKRIWGLAREHGERLEITKLSRRPKAHFASVDNGKVIRVEAYHAPGTPDRVAYRKKHSLLLGPRLEEDFTMLKESSKATASSARRKAPTA